MTVTEPHTLGTTAALERLKSFPAALKRQYEGRVAESQEEWQGNVLTFSIVGVRGRRIEGSVTVAADSVTVIALGDIPRIVEGIVKGQIRAALAEALGE